MHFGHTYNNYGPLDYLDVGYKSNGLQIGKERATIIGSGPLASAPAASAGNQNMFYMSTDFGLCKYVGVFRNEGVDWINCGRPAWLSNLVPKVNTFTIEATSSPKSLSFQSIVGLADVDPPPNPTKTQFLLGYKSGGAFEVYVGGTAIGGTSGLFPVNVFNRATVAVGLTQAKCYKNGVLDVSFNISTKVSSADLYIGALANGYNFEGDIASVRIYSGVNADGSTTGLTLLDKYDFNKWDGSVSGTSDMGYAYTVTKATPFTELSFACVPMSIL